MALNNYPIFSAHPATLRETSMDNHDGHCAYMTTSTRNVINFDNVKSDYVSSLGLPGVPTSCDALFESSQGRYIFVEFKSGFMNNAKQFSVRKKIYDSLLIFCDITSSNLSQLRSNAEFILVYNETANLGRNDNPEFLQKHDSIPPSPAFDAFAKSVSKLANTEYICFGLNIFNKYCFHEVHTYTQDEFEDYLKTH